MKAVSTAARDQMSLEFAFPVAVLSFWLALCSGLPQHITGALGVATHAGARNTLTEAHLDLADQQNWVCAVLAHEFVDVQVSWSQLWTRAVPADNVLTGCSRFQNVRPGSEQIQTKIQLPQSLGQVEDRYHSLSGTWCSWSPCSCGP